MTSHIFKTDGGLCYSGDELFQIREPTEEKPGLGLVRWRRCQSCALRGAFQANSSGPHRLESSDIRDSFLIWMDEKQIAACCPKLLERFLEGRIAKRCPPLKGKEEEMALVEEMKANVISLVERCDEVLKRFKTADSAYSMRTLPLFTSNLAILTAYAEVPELLQCMLDAGVVKLLADTMLFSAYREDKMHENSRKVLHALVSHPYDNMPSEIILQLINVISNSVEDDDLDMNLSFPEVTLTVVYLFASTVKKDSCSSLEQMPCSEIPGRIGYVLIQKYLDVVRMIDTDGIVCSCGPLHKQFEFAMRFTELMNDLFMVMGWGSHLLKGSEGGCHRKQNNKASIFTGLTTTHQLVKSLSTYKSRKDFSSDHEYGCYIKSVLKEDMWVKARCQIGDINVGQKGQFRYFNSCSPPARIEWEDYGLHWVHWHVLEIVDGNGGGQLELPSLPTGMQRKYLYRLSVSGNLGNIVERNDWWEVLFYLRKLNPSKLDKIFAMLPSYGVKSIDDMVEMVPTLQEAQQIIGHLRKHHPLLLSEPLSLEDTNAVQPCPHGNFTSADQVTIKPCPPMEDPCPGTEATFCGVVGSTQHEPSHLGQNYSSSCVKIAFGPEDNSSSGQEEEEATSTSITAKLILPLGNPSDTTDNIADANTSKSTVAMTSDNNTVDHSLGAAGLRRSSRIAVKRRKSFVDIISDNVNCKNSISDLSQPKKKKKRKELDYNALEVTLNLASAQLMHVGFCTKVDEILKNLPGDKPHGYRILAQCLTLLQNGLRHRHGGLLVEYALSGGFRTILHVMQLGSQSARVQCLGIICFFFQMGRCSYGYSVTSIPCDLHSCEERNSIMAIVHSLVSSHEHGGLRTVVKGLYCVANQYNKEMSDAEKRSSVEAVTNGLVVLANILHADGMLIAKMTDWELPKCLEVIRTEFPIFPGKDQLISIMDHFPLTSSTPSSDEKYCQEMRSLIHQLDEDSCQTAVFQLLGRISNGIVLDNCVKLVKPPSIFVRALIHWSGIAKLVNLLEKPSNMSSSVCSNIVLIIGCSAFDEHCAHVILQGGVRGLVTVLNQTTHPRRQEVKFLLEILKRMIMRADDINQSSHMMVVGVLFGTMQMIARHIDNCRHQQNHVILPRLGNFVQYMSLCEH